MCGAPEQGLDLRGVEVAGQTVIQGTVASGGGPVAGAYVRLLDAGGEFTAEVVSSATGAFRFFAAPGRWTVRALARQGSGESEVRAERGLTETEIAIG